LNKTNAFKTASVIGSDRRGQKMGKKPLCNNARIKSYLAFLK
jgi:hypothetical protein